MLKNGGVHKEKIDPGRANYDFYYGIAGLVYVM